MVGLARAATRQALLQVGGPPDLAFVFVTGPHPEQSERALLAAHALLSDATTVGCTAADVFGCGRSGGGAPAVAVWLARIPGLRARTFHLEVSPGEQGGEVVGLPGRRRDDVLALLLGDPRSFPLSDVVASSDQLLSGLPVVGAAASPDDHPGGVRMMLDGTVFDSGAVGVMLGGPLRTMSLVSPACRPVGPALTVTDAEGFLVRSLAGRPAALVVKELTAELDDTHPHLARSGLYLGVAFPHAADDPRMGDFLTHRMSPADGGCITVAAPVPIGALVQFQVRDEAAADEDLEVTAEGLRVRLGRDLVGALLFSSTGRGAEDADRDCAVTRDVLDVPVAGMATTSEVAPMRGQSRLHQYTATLLGIAGGREGAGGHEEAVRPRQVSAPDDVAAHVQRLLGELSPPPDSGPQ